MSGSTEPWDSLAGASRGCPPSEGASSRAIPHLIGLTDSVILYGDEPAFRRGGNGEGF